MKMPIKLQIFKIKDELKRKGISPDLVDVAALVDSSLTYPENLRIVLSKFKNVSKKASTGGKSKAYGKKSNIIIHFEMEQAKHRHSLRKKRAQTTDENRKTNKTITEKRIIRNPELLNKWHKNPNKYDIEGIDSFGYSKPSKRKRKTKPRKKKTPKRTGVKK